MIATAATTGCGDKATATKCKQGEVHDCVCKDEHASLQTCNAVTGAWEACMCPGDVPAAGSGAGAGGMSAGSGGMSGAGGAGAGGGASGSGAGTGAGTMAGDAGMIDPDAAMTADTGVATPAYSGPCPAAACPTDETCTTPGKYCAGACTTASLATDCPAAPSGTAMKTCTIPALATMGTCSLGCTIGMAGQCPTGMTCASLALLAPAVCTWP